MHLRYGPQCVRCWLAVLVVVLSVGASVGSSQKEFRNAITSYLHELGHQRAPQDGQHNRLPRVYQYWLQHFRLHEIVKPGLKYDTVVPFPSNANSEGIIFDQNSATIHGVNENLMTHYHWMQLSPQDVFRVVQAAETATRALENPFRSSTRVSSDAGRKLKLNSYLVLDVFRSPEGSDWGVAHFQVDVAELTADGAQTPLRLPWVRVRYLTEAEAVRRVKTGLSNLKPYCSIGELLDSKLAQHPKQRRQINIESDVAMCDALECALARLRPRTKITFQPVVSETTVRPEAARATTLTCSTSGNWEEEPVDAVPRRTTDFSSAETRSRNNGNRITQLWSGLKPFLPTSKPQPSRQSIRKHETPYSGEFSEFFSSSR